MGYKKHLSLISTLLLVVLLATACGITQPETFSVGVVNLLPTMENTIEGFKAGMIESGYTEGENITYVYPGAAGSLDALETTAQDLMKAEVDLILSITTPGSLAAQKATAGTDTPVVFVAVTDPVGAGLVQDWAHPGGNVTGIASVAKGAVNEGRRLELLLQIAPDVKRVYIPYNPEDPAVITALTTVSDDAAKLGVELALHEVRSADEAAAASGAIPEDVEAIFIFSDRVVVTAFQEFVEAALEKRLPLSTSNPIGVEMGALMAYGSDFLASGKQAARLADQIFKGGQAADLPVEAPEFFLIINLKTAEAIGLDVPDAVLRDADEIIR